MQRTGGVLSTTLILPEGIRRCGLCCAVIVTVACVTFPGRVFSQECLDEQKELRAQIQSLNLIRGLYLSDEQKEFLLNKAKAARELKEAYIAQYRQYRQDSEQGLLELKGELMEDTSEVSADVAGDVYQSQKRILELKADYEGRIGTLVRAVKNNLSSKQLLIIKEFKPCLVPPKGPARSGQSEDAYGLSARLERLRSMPPGRYAVKKYEAAEKLIEEALLHKPRGTEADKTELRQKVLAVFDQARGLSEVDFNLRKDELAKQLKEETSLKPETEIDIDARIEQFLLTPAVIAVLEEQLAL